MSEFCPWCGHEAREGHKFCRSCGRELPTERGDFVAPQAKIESAVPSPDLSVARSHPPPPELTAAKDMSTLASSSGAAETTPAEFASPLRASLSVRASNWSRTRVIAVIAVAAIIVLVVGILAAIGPITPHSSNGGAGGGGTGSAAVEVSSIEVSPSLLVQMTATCSPFGDVSTHAGGVFNVSCSIQTITVAPSGATNSMYVDTQSSSYFYISNEPAPSVTFTSGGGVTQYTWTDTVAIGVYSSTPTGSYPLYLDIQVS